MLSSRCCKRKLINNNRTPFFRRLIVGSYLSMHSVYLLAIIIWYLDIEVAGYVLIHTPRARMCQPIMLYTRLQNWPPFDLAWIFSDLLTKGGNEIALWQSGLLLFCQWLVASAEPQWIIELDIAALLVHTHRILYR